MSAADILMLTLAIVGLINIWRERIDEGATQRARFNMMNENNSE